MWKIFCKSKRPKFRIKLNGGKCHYQKSFPWNTLSKEIKLNDKNPTDVVCYFDVYKDKLVVGYNMPDKKKIT